MLNKGGIRMATIYLNLEGLNCAGCAGKIESNTDKIEGVTSASLDFVNKKLTIDLSDKEKENIIIDQVKDIVKKLEPDVIVTDLSKAQVHNHEHSHDHGDLGNKDIIKIATALILFILPFTFKLEGSLRFIIYFASYLIVGYKVIIRAFKNIGSGTAFDENFLMTIATVGAFIIGEYPEGVAVMLFYQIGRASCRERV